MRKALINCGYFSASQQDKLMLLLPDSGEEYRVMRRGDFEYFIVNTKGYYVYAFHICNCAGTVDKLNDAHQILIKHNAFNKFSRSVLESIGSKTHLFFNPIKSECYLWDEGNMFAFANAAGSYYYKISDCSESKQKMLSKIFNFGRQIYDIRVMRLITNTPDFEFEFDSDDFCAYYISKNDDSIEFCFTQNRSTIYKVVDNQLVKVEKVKEQKPEKKFMNSAELAARHIANLRKFILEHRKENVITLPKVYDTKVAKDWLNRLCTSRGYTIDSEFKILTFTGKSNGSKDDEFSDFQTSEERSQIFIDNMEQTILRHIAEDNCENSFSVTCQYAVLSSTFRNWLDNICKEYQFTYLINTNGNITIILF